MSYLDILKLAAPETIVVLAALAVLAVDLTVMRGTETRLRFVIGGMVAGVGCVAAAAWLVVVPTHGGVWGGMMVVNELTQLIKVGLLALTLFTVLISLEADFTAHVGEFLALILLATVGMMFLVSAENVLMVFVALELTSLSLYILTAFNKRNVRSAEAALKYFLFGGMAAAFMLFGLSLLYGLSGSTNLREIAAALASNGLDPLLVVAIVMTVIGFGFKVAAVPFHLWAPDAYEGAPTPSAAFIASGSKVASFFIFAQVMMIGFAGAEGSGAWRNYASGWVPAIAMVAALSMVLGNLVAIVQSNVKRLLAYSAIAHAGYALLGILANSEFGMASLIYYVITYGLTTLGAFGVVAAVEQGTGDAKLSDFAGLSRRAPFLSFCMFIFMLSLAGIPPLAGFFGKFYVFAAVVKDGAVHLGLLWLVILAIAMSAVSLYYYLQVLKRIYVADLPTGAEALRVPMTAQVALGMLAAGVVLLGCFPGLLVERLTALVLLVGQP
ncbi:MAG: NADH-quinone oxidoreductase subunit N [Verrucomicrobiae bacterium]|nr:NADH-quinone oxidoreductase subunit N [Verrucomicrobiae bacterium]